MSRKLSEPAIIIYIVLLTRKSRYVWSILFTDAGRLPPALLTNARTHNKYKGHTVPMVLSLATQYVFLVSLPVTLALILRLSNKRCKHP